MGVQIVERKIAEMREDYGSFRRLAAEAGISQSQLSLIVRRKRVPSLPTFQRLSKAMGVRADKLLQFLQPTA